jgi:hypothetical protein
LLTTSSKLAVLPLENSVIEFPAFLSKISVYSTSVPTVLECATTSGVLWQASAGKFLLDVPGVARYLVEAGQTISIERVPDADETAVVNFLRMAPLSALLNQRGILTFHAAAVANDQGAILLAGDSGCGKSTLLTELLLRGWKMLADELAAVVIDGQGRVMVPPIYPEIALWPDATNLFKKNADTLLMHDVNRRQLTLLEQFSSIPQRLRAIYWMSVQSNREVELIELSGVARFRAVRLLSYNSHITEALFDNSAFMRSMTATTQTAKVFCLRRPRGRSSVSDLANTITT